ncbi:Uridine phosphorylase 1 [Sarcoptes scabiei]|uniref:Uridine phosphorylase 1 n=1 Tax=Sarcoptes scabiei TaxID=52283 RepID=A0A834R849_SARSC|nr:Uridine phosphorylase 1 [Sarcoptes scabiei]
MNKFDDIEIIYEDSPLDLNPDGRIKLRNPHMDCLESDFLYHLGLDTKKNNLKQMFGDVKFICMGGTAERMQDFAQLVANELGIDGSPVDLAKDSHRYSMFKIGPVLSVSHGMGVSSLSILMHELFKVAHYADCKDLCFFRIGTSGGLGVPPGSIIITDKAVDELMRPFFELHISGKIVRRSCRFDAKLIEELKEIAKKQSNQYETFTGTTMCAMDFYETQSRLDGAFCNYTKEDKQNFLQKLSKNGVKNIEMEALVFGSMCQMACVRGAIVCVTLLNRLDGDQIASSKACLRELQNRPQRLVLDYIKYKLSQ